MTSPYSWSFTTGDLYASGEFELKSYTYPARHKPVIAMDSNGNYVVVWQDPNDGIQAQRYDSSGNPVGAEINVASNAYYSEYFGPAVAMNEWGDFVIAWKEDITWSQQPGSISVYGKKYNSDGTYNSQFTSTHSIPSYIYGYPENELYTSLFTNNGPPSVAMDSSGRYVVAYQAPSCRDTEATITYRWQCDKYIFGKLYSSDSSLIKWMGTDYETYNGGNQYSRTVSTPIVNNIPHLDVEAVEKVHDEKYVRE